MCRVVGGQPWGSGRLGVITMPFDAVLANATPRQAAAAWLRQFQSALDKRDAAAAASLFSPDGHWRDVLAFTWHIETRNGRTEIADELRRTVGAVRPREFRVAEGRAEPRMIKRAGIECIEALIAFETDIGTGAGTLRLVPDVAKPGCTKAWILATSLEEITGHEEKIDARRPGMEAFSRDFGGDNWLDLRERERAFADREPAVVVVGAGQAGLSIAARLKVLGVDTLVIDRENRIGDNWRMRYHSLVLHNEVHVNHLPYMPFPPNCPVYIPKDKLANWFETYADSMELNVWTGTELVAGSYDEASATWSLDVRRPSGQRTLKPRHVVMATGVSAIPVHPSDVPGLDAFAGDIVHSGAYTTGHAWQGKNALVMGTGNSGHDVAQDLHACGVNTTMIQRNTTYIVSLKEAQKVYSIYEEGPSVADCDLLAMALPYPVAIRAYQMSTEEMRRADQPLLDGLAKRGFKLDMGGDDATGFQMKYMRRGGGYYFNVGCSDLIVNGEVGLIQFDDIDTFVAEGARMKDGTLVPADLLVTATGFKNQQDVVRTFMGDAIADRAGPVWGFNDGGELRNMWCRTPQPGLWFTAGSLAQCRIYSKYLALQIMACEEGLIPAQMPAPVKQAA
jgi:thioredoxin reductase